MTDTNDADESMKKFYPLFGDQSHLIDSVDMFETLSPDGTENGSSSTSQSDNVNLQHSSLSHQSPYLSFLEDFHTSYSNQKPESPLHQSYYGQQHNQKTKTPNIIAKVHNSCLTQHTPTVKDNLPRSGLLDEQEVRQNDGPLNFYTGRWMNPFLRHEPTAADQFLSVQKKKRYGPLMQNSEQIRTGTGEEPTVSKRNVEKQTLSYIEMRKKNNEACKRSRERRKQRENDNYANLIKQEETNMSLHLELATTRKELDEEREESHELRSSLKLALERIFGTR